MRFIMVYFDTISTVDLPVLSGGQLYIYVIENAPQGNIKIGRTHDIKSRLQSLSGSNNGGNYIARGVISDSTYLYTLERLLHQKFDFARIDGTEWFDGTQVKIDDVVMYLDELFHRSDYQRCNDVRRMMYEQGIQTNKSVCI